MSLPAAPASRRKHGVVGGVADRQLGGLEDLVAMEVRDRDLGRRDQVQVVARDDVHLVFLVRDLAGAPGRRGVDDGRRPDLGEAVLAGVDVEEPADERALEGRAEAAVDREARAGDLRAALEVEDAQAIGDVPVRLALPGRAAAGASAPTSPPSGWTGAGARPTSRTVTFASSPPTGTSGSAGFGIRSRRSSSSASTVASSASSAAIRAPAAVEAAFSAAISGPFGSAPPRIASPIAFDAWLRSALSRSPSASSSRRRASAASACIDERRVLALVDRALADDVAASSRRRCSPTLIRRPPPGRRPRTPRNGRRRTPGRGWPAASRRAGRSAGRGRPGRGPRRHGRPPVRRPVATEKMSACQASPGLRRRRLGGAAASATEVGALVGLEHRGLDGERRADGHPGPIRGVRIEPGPGSRGALVEDGPLAFGQRTALLRLDPRRHVDAGDLPEQGEVGEGRPEGGRLGRDVGVRVEQRVAEDRLEAGRQLALDLAAGGRGGEPVELVEQARDRVRPLGIELDRRVRPGPQEQEAELLGRDHLGRSGGRRRRGPSRSTSCGRRCSGTRTGR